MNVKKLKEILATLDDNTPVLVSRGDGVYEHPASAGLAFMNENWTGRAKVSDDESEAVFLIE